MFHVRFRLLIRTTICDVLYSFALYHVVVTDLCSCVATAMYCCVRVWLPETRSPPVRFSALLLFLIFLDMIEKHGRWHCNCNMSKAVPRTIWVPYCLQWLCMMCFFNAIDIFIPFATGYLCIGPCLPVLIWFHRIELKRSWLVLQGPPVGG